MEHNHNDGTAFGAVATIGLTITSFVLGIFEASTIDTALLLALHAAQFGAASLACIIGYKTIFKKDENKKDQE